MINDNKSLIWAMAAALMCSMSVFTSCSSDNDAPETTPQTPQPVVLTGDAAVEWTRAHLDSLADVYLASCGNKLDPDATRALLSCIGYTGLDVVGYMSASDLIDSVVFIRLMDRAVATGNKTIVYTMGMGGCGKSTGLRNNPELQKKANEAGVVYDGAFYKASSFDKKVAKSNARGLEPTVVYVYNDAETGFTNCVERLIATNRVIPYPTYVAFFPYYQGRIEHFEQNYPDMPVYCLDNSHNNGGRLVTTDEARQWDYTMDAALQNKLYTIMWTYILSGKMTDDQIYAVQKPERM